MMLLMVMVMKMILWWESYGPQFGENHHARLREATPGGVNILHHWHCQVGAAVHAGDLVCWQLQHAALGMLAAVVQLQQSCSAPANIFLQAVLCKFKCLPSKIFLLHIEVALFHFIGGTKRHKYHITDDQIYHNICYTSRAEAKVAAWVGQGGRRHQW